MELIIMLVVLVGGFAFLGYLINRKQTSTELLEVVRLLNSTSQKDRESLNLRLDNTARVMSEVQRNLGEMNEIGRGMRDLQAFLSSPKLRGNIGEHVLKELLSQSLPKSAFFLQYSFKSGHSVDAAVKTQSGIIPIDSKFPMENFRRMSSKEGEVAKRAAKDFEKDVRAHIISISRKYILPHEGTIDYALMYIPSEAVYYEIANNPDLFDFAGKKRVLPVSPTTFWAYLRAILMSLEGQKIETKTREILSHLRTLEKDYEESRSAMILLQKHMNNAQNAVNNLVLLMGKLGTTLLSTKTLTKKQNDRSLEEGHPD